MPEPQGETTGRQTIYEVANAAGVSIATVSRVLSKPEVVSPTTRERVLRAVDELNYVPDGAARSRCSQQRSLRSRPAGAEWPLLRRTTDRLRSRGRSPRG